MRRIIPVLISFACLTAFSACGKSGPASPSGLGATITGEIVAPVASSAGRLGSTISATGSGGLTVSVSGTSLSAPVDGANRFTLKGVPEGDALLQFTGSGVNADLSLSDVQSGESITMSVSLDSTSATLQTLSRGMGSQQQLEGRVESLPPTTTAGTFIVAGKTILTDGQTQFVIGGTIGSFSDLAIGIRVHVSGQASNGGLLARVVDIQNTNGDLPVDINGIIQGFSGSSNNFQFTIDGRLIKGDALTNFFGGTVFSDLADGARAEVKGLQRDGFVYATDIKVNTGDGSGQDQSASIDGTLVAKSGGFPVFQLTVGTTKVITSADTVVQRRGDVQDLNVLQLGMDLHVVGDRQSDGSINARFIQIKDDQTGGLFQISGPMGGVSGTCPAIQFGVNGYSIFTDGSTTFTPACSGLKSGTPVLVKGVVQADGRVKATSVAKQ